MKNLFTEHPKQVGEGYFQHCWFAVKTGSKLMVWGIIAVIHGIFPFLFITYVSEKIKQLYLQINKR